MWHVYCPDCGHGVLVGPGGVCELVNHGNGLIVVVLRCPAGHPISVRTGRAADARG